MAAPIISKLKSNWGVMCAGIVLLILLVLNYNRCYAMPEMFLGPTGVDLVAVPTTTQPIDITTSDSSTCCSGTFPPPTNMTVNVTPTTCTIHFTITLSAGVPIPQKIAAVLGKYDKNKKIVGSTNFYLSDEYTLNNAQALNASLNQNMCSIFNGVPSCQYTFTDLQAVDTNGDSYFYKVGVSAIYANGNSEFITPINIASDYFVLDTNINAQTAAYNEYLQYTASQKALQNSAAGIGSGASNYRGTLATADGQYEMMKQQLGNYPNNLEISEEMQHAGTLADLVDKSMALGKVIVNVKSG